MQKTVKKVRVGARAATSATVKNLVGAANKRLGINFDDLDNQETPTVAKPAIIIEDTDTTTPAETAEASDASTDTVDASTAPSATAVKKGELSFIEGDDEDTSPFFKMLLGGLHKTGKTIMATSVIEVPEFRDVIYADVDAGFASAVSVVPGWKNITRVKIKDYDSFLKLYKFANAHARARSRGDEAKIIELANKFGVNPARHFRTIIIDVINAIDRINLLDSYGNKDVALTRNVETGNFSHATKHTTVMQDLLRKLKDLPMNVIFICHFKANKDTKKLEPEMRGQLSSLIQRDMDLVGFMNQGTSAMPNNSAFSADDDDEDGDDDILISKKKKKAKKLDATGLPIQRVMWLQPVGPFEASSRITPPELLRIDNPSMAKLWEYITPALRTINKNAA